MKETDEFDFDEDHHIKDKYPEYIEEDSDRHSEEQYEMVFEDKLDEATDLLYNHPESFAEIMEELRVEDREYEFDFAKVLMDSLKDLPSSSEETNVIRSHSLITKIATAYDNLVDAYAETLTRKELGG